MKAIHVIENIDEMYGGPAKSVPFLCKHLMKLGVDTEIHSVQKYPIENNSIIEENNIPWVNNKNTITDVMRYSSTLSSGIKQAIISNESILHTQNQWNYPPYCAYNLHKKCNVPLICSVRGSLYPWSLRQYKYYKKFFWYVFQNKMLQNANCIHVTERNEYKAVRELGINSPIAIISNGVELEEFDNLPNKALAKNKLKLSQDKKYILFMSRIHPKKGLDLLIKSWIELSKLYQDWQILIAGPIGDKNYFNKVKNSINESSLQDKIIFLGMLDQQTRIQAYAAADLFALPSHTENFGIVIAEALAAGVPVITTHNTPWSDIEKENCGWWIELTEEKLKTTLADAMNTSTEELSIKGNNGILLIRKKYSWDIQAEKMLKVYQWLLNKADKPSFVYDGKS